MSAIWTKVVGWFRTLWKGTPTQQRWVLALIGGGIILGGLHVITSRQYNLKLKHDTTTFELTPVSPPTAMPVSFTPTK